MPEVTENLDPLMLAIKEAAKKRNRPKPNSLSSHENIGVHNTAQSLEHSKFLYNHDISLLENIIFATSMQDLKFIEQENNILIPK